MEHAEDGDICAHAERQRRHRDRGESRRAEPRAERVPRILFRHAPMLAGCMKQEVADDLDPETYRTLLRLGTEHHRHLLSVLVPEIAWIDVEKPAIDAFRRLHGVILRSIEGS